MKLFTIIAMACLAVSAFGQTTNMVASNFEGDATSSNKFTGKICVTPTLADQATAFSADGVAQVLPVRTCYPITAGVVNAVVPNTSLANPPIGLKAVVQDTFGNQVYAFHDLIFTSAAPLNLDQYAPTQTVKVTSPTFNFSTSAPTGDCGSAAAEDYSGTVNNVSTYFCIAHQWVLQAGTGGGGAQADWNAVAPSLAAILNEPTLGTAAAHAATDFDAAGTAASAAASAQATAEAFSSGLASNYDVAGAASAAEAAAKTFASGLAPNYDAAGAAASALVSAKSYADGKAANYDAAGTASAAIAALPASARSGSYTDLINKPTLGTAAAQNASAFDAAGAAASAQSAAEAASDPVGSAASAQSAAEAYAANASHITSGTLPHAQLPTLVSADIPTNAANTSGSAGSLSAASALPSGTTATTQSASDNSTKVATTAYVATAVAAIYSNNGLALPTSSIAANTCTAVTGSPFTASAIAPSNYQTVAASFGWTGGFDPATVNGYGSTGGLSVKVTIPAAGQVAVKVCNPNATSITPGTMEINVRVNP